MRTVTVALNELYNHARRPSFWLSTLLVPVLLAGFSVFSGSTLSPGALLEGSAPSVTAFVDRSGVTEGVMHEMPGGHAGEYQKYPTAEAARAAMASGEVEGFYVIPEGYLKSGELRYYSGSNNPLEGREGRMETLLTASLLDERGYEYARRISSPVAGLIVEGEGAGPAGEQSAFAVGFLFALLLYVSIFSSSSFLLRAVVEEKENRVMEILVSSASARQLLRGKMLGLGALGLAQISVWSAAGYATLGRQGAGPLAGLSISPESWALALGCFLLGYAMYAALMTAVGSVATTMRESSQLTFVVIVPVLAPLAFLSVLIEQPHSLLAQILTYIPLTAPVTLPVRQVVDGVSAPSIAVSVALMFLTVFFLQAAATRIFRAHTLLSGGRPTPAAILRALR